MSDDSNSFGNTGGATGGACCDRAVVSGGTFLRGYVKRDRRPTLILSLTAVISCGRENFDPAHNLAFVTSTVHSPIDFGSDLSGADEICALRASDAGLPGPFVAFVGREARPAIDRLGNSRGWVRPDGLPFADRPIDVGSGRLFYPLRIDERGEDLGSDTSDTRIAIGNFEPNSLRGTCDDYTDTASELTAVPVDTSGKPWSSTGDSVQIPCTRSVHLACFGIGFDAELEPVAVVDGRLAFVTTQDFVPGGGLAAADALCEQEALLAGLAGRFRALLPTNLTSAASRFDLGGSAWQRVDGVALATSPLAFVDGTLQASFFLTALGTPVQINRVLTGGRLGAVPDNACSDWTSPSDLTRVGEPERSGAEVFDDEEGVCVGAIYCLEE